MDTWPVVGRSGDFPPGEARTVLLEGAPICVARAEDGRLYAVQDHCPHHGVSLGGMGAVEGGKIVCGWHRWSFDLASGESPISPAAALRCYALSEEGGEVRVDPAPPPQPEGRGSRSGW